MHLGYTVLEFVIYTMLTGQHKRLDHAQNLYKKLQMIENLNDTAGSEYVNLRRFYGAPNTSIYRYFIVRTLSYDIGVLDTLCESLSFNENFLMGNDKSRLERNEI